MSTQTSKLCKPTCATEAPRRAEHRPPVDILASETGFEVTVEMPGVDESGVDVTIEKNVLTIRGKAELPVHEGLSATHREFGIGDLRRSFTLSDDIDPDSVDAEMRNGLLTLKLSRRQPAGPKKVKIKSA